MREPAARGHGLEVVGFEVAMLFRETRSKTEVTRQSCSGTMRWS